MVYTADAVREHPAVALTRGGLILFALLAGGDYDAVRVLLSSYGPWIDMFVDSVGRGQVRERDCTWSSLLWFR
jgi:hypothetical protein